MQPVPCARCQALQRGLDDLQAENERLRHQLDEASRARKRQAAPFAKGQPAGQPKKPGRKPGKDYGTKAHRQPPGPEQIDEVHEAPLPDACPECGGPLMKPTSPNSSRSRFRASPSTASSTSTSGSAGSAAVESRDAIHC